MSESTSSNDKKYNTALQPCWYVMLAKDPNRFEDLLLEENQKRMNAGKSMFHTFIPYQFLKRRISDENPQDCNKNKEFINPKSRENVSKNNDLRSILRQYIFIKAIKSDLDVLFTEAKTMDTYRELRFLRNKSKDPVTVPDHSMELFINECCDLQIQFEVWPTFTGLKKHQKVVLNTTVFKGQTAYILGIKKNKDGDSEITAAFYIPTNVAIVKVFHLHQKDLLIEGSSVSLSERQNNRLKVIEDTQRRVFNLVKHSFDDNLDEATIRRDLEMLQKLNAIRYYQYESTLLQSKHISLMLLCSMLSHDRYGMEALKRKALIQIDALKKKLEETPGHVPSQIMLAYIQSVLYIVTLDPTYYEQSMAYYTEHPNASTSSDILIKFMKLRKTTAD